jgi:hypothetical protein
MISSQWLAILRGRQRLLDLSLENMPSGWPVVISRKVFHSVLGIFRWFYIWDRLPVVLDVHEYVVAYLWHLVEDLESENSDDQFPGMCEIIGVVLFHAQFLILRKAVQTCHKPPFWSQMNISSPFLKKKIPILEQKNMMYSHVSKTTLRVSEYTIVLPFAIGTSLY